MTRDIWRKSSHSGGGDGNTSVEVGNCRDRISIRDSKDPDRATLTVPAGAFTAFVEALKYAPASVTDPVEL